MYKEKCKDTCLKRYGVDHPSKTIEYKEKCKETFLKHYGVTNPNKTQEVRDKIKKTNLERYGVEYSSQCPEIMEKTQKKMKPSSIILNISTKNLLPFHRSILQVLTSSITCSKI
jgi:hypothetical protein